MLSTAKVRTGSWRYYSNQVGRGACEYFLGAGEAPGRWYGRGLDGLGLERRGEVREWQLEATFGRAIHPAAKAQLGRAWRSDGVTGYDLCFSAPKSVSALWALGGGDIAVEIACAHAAAVRAGLDYLDDHAAYSRIGRNGHTQVDTAGFTAAIFDHRTSRSGDPQLHTHALVLNKLQCPDGRWRTIDGHEIYAHKKSAGVIYQVALRSELTRRLGVAWAPVSKDGQAEILGVPTGLSKLWSSRTEQTEAEAAPVIAAHESELGRPLTSTERTAVMKVAVIATRPDKEQVDIVGLIDRWHDQAGALGWTPDRLVAAVRDARSPHPGLRDDDARILEALTAAGARKAIFTRSDLAAEIAARIPTDTALDASTIRRRVEELTDQALNTPEAVKLTPERDGPARASDARYASAATLGRELDILDLADRGRGAGYAVCHPTVVLEACRAEGLDYAQTHAVNMLTRNGDQISVLVAPAGTGKTTTLAAMVSAWHASGHQVIGLAPSARAAKELSAATGLPTDTVAKYLHENASWPVSDRYRLRPGAVMIVDEGSMLPTADLHALAHDVNAAGGKLLIVGDPAQIGAIDSAGGMLAPLAERLGAPALDQVHRFHHLWERRASLQLRAGSPEAINAYLDHDRIHPLDPDTDPYATVVTDYLRLSARGERTIMLARTHDDVEKLNTRAREHAISTGQVHGEPLAFTGDREWRVGDRLRTTRNDRHIPVGTDHLRNGDQFTVTGRTAAGLAVQRLDGPATAVLHFDYLTEHATYGWASTIDAAQGATVDHALLLARPGLDRTRLYVGLTRGRETNHLYLAPVTEPEIRARNEPTPPIEPKRALQRILETLDEHAASHTRLPELRPGQRPAAAPTQTSHQREADDRWLRKPPRSHDLGRYL